MKKIGIILTFVSMFAMVSCSALSGSTTSTAAATNGATTGAALSALYKSKKAGTLSVTNASDLTNILTVINGYNSLKANKDVSSYKTAFATGMITGGNGLITAANSTTVMNALLNSSALSGVSSTNIVNKATTTISAINTILAVFGSGK
ncbi:MAG: hypothetical protein K5864_00685 [Bacteroidales bacterium]|nr:hypothetical protein [Bacteroidales bacterium]